MSKMKISLDFDGTLSKPRIQDLAKLYVAKGHDVHVTTARFEDSAMDLAMNPAWNDTEHKILYKIALECGIPPEKVHFTNLQPKYDYLDGFDIHYDDDWTEIEIMEESNIKCVGILIG